MNGPKHPSTWSPAEHERAAFQKAAGFGSGFYGDGAYRSPRKEPETAMERHHAERREEMRREREYGPHKTQPTIVGRWSPKHFTEWLCRCVAYAWNEDERPAGVTRCGRCRAERPILEKRDEIWTKRNGEAWVAQRKEWEAAWYVGRTEYDPPYPPDKRR